MQTGKAGPLPGGRRRQTEEKVKVHMQLRFVTEGSLVTGTIETRTDALSSVLVCFQMEAENFPDPVDDNA